MNDANKKNPEEIEKQDHNKKMKGTEKDSKEKKFAEVAAKDKDAYRFYIQESKKDSNPRKYFNDECRGEYSVDIDKIIHCPFYNRYSDKTQVFSLRNNDNLTRRATHVQLVARIAHIIGDKLGLNTDLIQAIALGHDIGHTPFGHAGEQYLDQLYYGYTKHEFGKPRRFFHNVQSVRALMKVAGVNLTAQTYDGIVFHNGEELKSNEKDKDGDLFKLRPKSFLNSIIENDMEIEKNNKQNGKTSKEENGFDKLLEDLTTGEVSYKKFSASTLEGCVVRISDMLAYVYKDQQDARKANYWKTVRNKKGYFVFDEVIASPKETKYGELLDLEDEGKKCFCITTYGNGDNDKNDVNNRTPNYHTIPEFIKDIIVNSGEDDEGAYLGMTKSNYKILTNIKNQNSKYMYIPIDEEIEPFIKPIFMAVYAQMRDDFQKKIYDVSPIFSDHTQWFENCYKTKKKDGKTGEYIKNEESGRDKMFWKKGYTKEKNWASIDEVVVDFIASMTDDYIIDLYGYLLQRNEKPKSTNRLAKKEKMEHTETILVKSCFIKTELPIKTKKDKQYKHSSVIECNVLWDEELYNTIKYNYSLSYFKEIRKEQIKQLKEKLNYYYKKTISEIEAKREERLRAICSNDNTKDIQDEIEEIKKNTELTHEEIRKQIAVSLFSDYKFVHDTKSSDIVAKISKITSLDEKEVKIAIVKSLKYLLEGFFENIKEEEYDSIKAGKENRLIAFKYIIKTLNNTDLDKLSEYYDKEIEKLSTRLNIDIEEVKNEIITEFTSPPYNYSEEEIRFLFTR